ncbi:hypothetical protein Pelo_5323 [Pelomyxa schiedti]|nr:hypothetical protein Pelo_5323 [Pelomyxa schiedti]
MVALPPCSYYLLFVVTSTTQVPTVKVVVFADAVEQIQGKEPDSGKGAVYSGPTRSATAPTEEGEDQAGLGPVGQGSAVIELWDYRPSWLWPRLDCCGITTTPSGRMNSVGSACHRLVENRDSAEATICLGNDRRSFSPLSHLQNHYNNEWLRLRHYRPTMEE